MNDLNIYLDDYVVNIGTSHLIFECKNVQYKLKGPFLNTAHNDVLTIRNEYFSCTAHSILDYKMMFNFIIRATQLPIDIGFVNPKWANPYQQFITND